MGFLLRRLDDNGSHCFSEISISTSSDNKSSLSFPRDVYAPFPESNHTVVGYCKGLFCLEYDDGKIIVWNPATKEFKTLPPSDMKLSIPRPHCKAHVISRVRGLGFDPASRDYKVVRLVTVFYANDDIREFCEGTAKRAEVYSLKDECWKEINGVLEESDVIDDYAICIDGVCFWKGVVMRGEEPIVIRLDLADDRFSTKPFPRDRDAAIVMEFDGALGLIMYEPLKHRRKFLRHYWATDERHEWIQRCPRLTVRAERPLGYCTTQLLLLEDFDTKLLVYDSVTRELNKIHHIFDHPHTMQLFPYVETTISLQTSPTPTPTPCIKRFMGCEEKIASERESTTDKEMREWIRKMKKKMKKDERASKEIHTWITRKWKKRLLKRRENKYGRKAIST